MRKKLLLSEEPRSSDKTPPSRRKILIQAGAGLAALMIGCAKAGGDASERGRDTDTDTDACSETPSDIQGPFWREGVPVRTEFDLHGDQGVSLTISGLVTDLDCVPLANAIVEIWHGFPTTVAVEDLKNSDSVDYDHNSAAMMYRGQMATDANGAYQFHTLKPGWYLNGASFRPSHIHVKIWVDGVERLTTQLYFQGDPFIEADAWATAEMTVPIAVDSGGAVTGNFDFAVEASA